MFYSLVPFFKLSAMKSVNYKNILRKCELPAFKATGIRQKKKKNFPNSTLYINQYLYINNGSNGNKQCAIVSARIIIMT